MKLSQSFLCARIMLVLACVLVIAGGGCSRKNAEVAGLSIPVPDKMTKVADKGFVPMKGFEDGQVAYEGKVSPAEIFRFYQEVMAADGWQPSARFANQNDSIAYTKNKRLVWIRYEQAPNGTTVLTIMVGREDPPT